MIYGSVCSGIESATVAWHPLGWRAAFYAEIEAFPNAVLAHHYPGVKNLGDIRRFSEWPDAAIDVLVGGTPCQSSSVAGLREGLDDPRGNLMLTYLAIAERYRPAWLVWENVPGVLSSGGGRDFGVFVWALGKLGYGWAYRVLDAQYFNLAQRRARVFVVGSLRGWPSAAAVLFERASLSGNPAPSRGTRKDVAGTIAGGARKRGGYSSDDIEHVAQPLLAKSNSSHDDSKETYIAHSLRADGFDASEDGSGRGTPLVPDISPALKARDCKGPSSDGDGDGAPLIPICFDETQITSAENRCNQQPGDPSHPLAAGARPPTIAFDCKAGGDTGFAINSNVAGALRGDGYGGGHAAVAEPYTLASRGRGDGHQLEYRQDGTANALLTPNGGRGGRGGIGVGAIATRYAVRRLTPRECERLQGFEDDYTLVLYRGKPAADGPRYKALGNSKAVPVVRYIGRRIDLVNQLLQERAA